MLKRRDGSFISIIEWLETRKYEEDWYPEPCTVPCPFPAGSPEKIAFMRWRVESGEDLYHPLDLRRLVKPPRTSPVDQGARESGIRVIDVASLIYRPRVRHP